MLRDVLKALSQASAPERIVVMTASPRVVRVARPYGFEILHETAVRGHSAAVNQAIRQFSPAARILALASDLPAIRAEDIDGVFRVAAAQVSLVPSREGTGTNAVLMSAGTRMDMDYGVNSLGRHLGTARAGGFSVELLRVPGIEFDLDTAEDLRHLLGMNLRDSEAWRYVSGDRAARAVRV
jgi:2-phospho-L-lactate guanylyltransferase